MDNGYWNIYLGENIMKLLQLSVSLKIYRCEFLCGDLSSFEKPLDVSFVRLLQRLL